MPRSMFGCRQDGGLARKSGQGQGAKARRFGMLPAAGARVFGADQAAEEA